MNVNSENFSDYFLSTDALTARSRFRWRRVHNVVALSAIFVPVIVFIAWLAWFLSLPGIVTLIAQGVAIAFAYHLYELWDKRPIKMACGKCKKIILSNTPWICGFKQCKNENPDNFPFVHKCEHCGAEPKAYRCHHRDPNGPRECEEIIFLSEDELERNYAYCAEPEHASRAAKLKIAQDSRQDKENEILMAELDVKLKEIKDRLEPAKVKMPYERAQDECEHYFQKMMGPREYVRQKRAEVDTLYKNHPELREDAHAVLNAILKKVA